MIRSSTRRSRPGARGLAAVLVLVGAPLAAQIPETVDPAEIPRYRVLRPGLAVGGQPSPQALMRLEEMGFKTIVNLRTRQEGAAEQEQVVRALGLDSVWVPVSSRTFSIEAVEAVEKVLQDPERGPVLLHCAGSDRVGAVWAVIQVREGRSLEEAEAAGRAAGLRSAGMWEAVLRVLGVEDAAADSTPSASPRDGPDPTSKE